MTDSEALRRLAFGLYIRGFLDASGEPIRPQTAAAADGPAADPQETPESDSEKGGQNG